MAFQADLWYLDSYLFFPKYFQFLENDSALKYTPNIFLSLSLLLPQPTCQPSLALIFQLSPNLFHFCHFISSHSLFFLTVVSVTVLIWKYFSTCLKLFQFLSVNYYSLYDPVSTETPSLIFFPFCPLYFNHLDSFLFFTHAEYVSSFPGKSLSLGKCKPHPLTSGMSLLK